MMRGFFLSLVSMQNPCSICSNYLFSRVMILTMWFNNHLSSPPGLIVPTISSCFLSNAMKALTAEWKQLWMLPKVSQIFLSHLCILITAWSAFFHEGNHKFVGNVTCIKVMHANESCWQFFLNKKRKYELWAQSDFRQSQFICHKWPLTKRIFKLSFIKHIEWNQCKKVNTCINCHMNHYLTKWFFSHFNRDEMP